MGNFLRNTLLILGILILLLVGAAVVLPIIYKDKIVEYVKTEANKRINAKLDFNNDIDLGIFRSFPNLSLKIDSISIINKAPFEGDTLLYAGSMNATLDIMSVIRGEKIAVRSFELRNPVIQLLVDTTGAANWDIALKTDEELQKEGKDTASKFRIALQHYAIYDGRLTYEDRQAGFTTELKDFDHHGNGDFTQDVFTLSTHTDAQQFTFNYDGTDYLDHLHAILDADLLMDLKNFKFTFKDNNLLLNALNIGFDGYIAMPAEDILMDLAFKARQTDFKNILSILPSIYKKDFNNLQAKGKFALEGRVNGTYNEKSYPGFNALLNITNGYFKYPDLPSAVTDVQMDTRVQSPGGESLDNTVINVSRAHWLMAGNPFDMHMLVRTPVSNPYVDGAIKGKVNLDDIEKFMKLDKGTSLAGLLNADLNMKGHISSLQNGQYEKFDARGFIAGQNIHYASAEIPEPVDISTTRLDFTPEYAKLAPTPVKMGESDLTADGNISNFLGYLFHKGTINGTLNLTSNYFNVNPWMSSSPQEAKSTEPTSAIDLPQNVDFTLNAKMNRVAYQNLDIKNLGGILRLNNKKLNFNNVAMNLLGGSFTLNGDYDSKNPVQPSTNLKLAISKVQISDMFAAFTSVQKLVPIAKYMSGSMSANISLSTLLDKTMSPIWSSLASDGVLSIPRAVLANFTPWNAVAQQLKMPELQNVVLTGIQPSYTVRDGRFILGQPIKFSIGKNWFVVTGSNGIDKTLDYNMVAEVPAGYLKTLANTQLEQILKSKNIQLDANKPVKLNIHIGGTIERPDVKLDLKDALQQNLGSVKDQIKNEVKQQIDQKVDEAKQKARAEADKILAQAQQQADLVKQQAQNLADQAKQEGYKQAKQLEDAAGDNPIKKQAAKIAADKIRQETDNKVNQIINEGNRRADDIMKKAKDQVNVLLK
jgi:hypothetical protein